MKTKLYIILLIIFISGTNAIGQVAIGKGSTRDGVILDFDETTGNTKGIILPIVSIDSLNYTYSNGTILVDRNDKTVKIRWNNSWRKLSDEGSFDAQMVGSEPHTTAAVFMTNIVADPDSKVIIGDQSSTADGILVLESPNQALVLPKVEEPHLNVPKPVAGTICYDTEAKAIAIFDGKVWSYWK